MTLFTKSRDSLRSKLRRNYAYIHVAQASRLLGNAAVPMLGFSILSPYVFYELIATLGRSQMALDRQSSKLNSQSPSGRPSSASGTHVRVRRGYAAHR